MRSLLLMLTDFKKILSARFLFTFATTMQAVLIGWRMYTLTHDPLYLGLIGLTEAIPALSLALYAGYVVDRSRPLFVYRHVLIGSLFSGFVFLLSQHPYFDLSLHAQVTGLFFTSFISGSARGFSQPALYAAIPRILPRENLRQGAAWMTSAYQIAGIAGAGLGGLIFGMLGITVAAIVVIVFLFFALSCLLLVKASPAAPLKSDRPLAIKKELLSGLVFVFKHPILLPALSLDMISVLFGGVTALLPIYASDILNVGPKGLGLLRAVPAIGAALTSLWLGKVTLGHNAGRWLFLSVTGFGVCILVFAVSRDFYLSLFVLGLSGAFDSVSMVIRTTAVQLVSPDSMRGRISAVNSIFIGSSNELGEFESGLAAKFMGTVPSVLFGGCLAILTVLGAALLSPSLRKLDLEKLASERN